MTPERSGSEQVFVRREKVGMQAVLLIVGGLLFTLALLGYFILLINSPAKPGDDMMPGLIGGVSVIGIGMLMYGIFLLRTTIRVVLDLGGVHIENFLGRKSVAWIEIVRVERDKSTSLFGGKTYQVIRLIDRTGKPLAVIAETIADFEELAAEISARSSAATGSSTYDPVEDQQRRISRDARRVKKISWAFAFFTLAMACGLCAGIYEELHIRRFNHEAVRVDAKILRRWMVNVTPHVEYTFSDDQGHTYTKETMMWQGPEWDKLEGQDTVPIEYLRSDPAWNRLVAGEDPGARFGGKFILICIGGILMFGTLFVITLLGYDLKTENGVTTLTRYGQDIKTWGTPSK